MKLHNRLCLSLAAGMALTICGSQAFQYWKLQNLITELGDTNARSVRQRLSENVEGTLHALEFGIQQSMASGDMDTFQKAARLQKDIKGLLELSLFNSKGAVSFSSASNRMKASLEQDLKERLLIRGERIEREYGGAMEVYQPQVVIKSCRECHPEWKESSIPGVLYFRFSTEAITQADAESRSGAQKASRSSLLFAVIGLGSGLIIMISLVQLITRPITSRLGAVVDALKTSSEQVNDGAAQLTGASQAIAEGASEQAASLEETSASLEQISAMTKRNADNAGSSKSLSHQARDSAASGLDRISEMGRTLTMVRGAVGEMDSAVSEMQSSSQEIAKIIKTIDEIAFQTNLLALNAAVEAARAGEAGAGFAVVADEVRSLAQRSAQAAKDTSEKIEAAVKRSALGGVASKKVVHSLGEIEASAGKIEQVFSGIVTQIKSLDEIVSEISAASQDQSHGISEVNMAVNQMDKVTQSNAASAEENASAANELHSQAASLQSIVGQLQAVLSGTQTQPVPPDRGQYLSRIQTRQSARPAPPSKAPTSGTKATCSTRNSSHLAMGTKSPLSGAIASATATASGDSHDPTFNDF